jgi:DNA polymerase-3 subunit gamma/tau
MSYLVLARKWRPQKFDEMVGQEHVVRTLTNAIKLGRIAHAYLFSGHRGVGKTTMARLLAKALNCINGPTTEPCGVCPSCVAIAAGTDLDVIEIDGASNRGIEDIRALRERVAYKAARGGYRVYVIDEVHMLTPEAWNALLKTLEEPPEKVIFIMATTAPHKVPPTITSRVQHLAFHLLPIGEILGRLEQIRQADGLDIGDDALQTIAAEAAGSLRDGLSLLDQVVAAGGTNADAVRQILGQISPVQIGELADAILKGEGGAAMGIIAGLYAGGADMEQAFKQLLGYFRQLTIAGVVEDSSAFTELTPEQWAELRKSATEYDSDHLLLVYRLLVEQGTAQFRILPPRPAFELAALMAARMHGVINLGDLIAVLKRRQGGTPEPLPASAPAAIPRPKAGNPGPPAAATAVPSAQPSFVPPAPVDDSGGMAMFADMDGLPDNDHGKLIGLLESRGDMPLAMAVRACNLSPAVKGMMRLELKERNNYLLTVLEDRQNIARLEQDLSGIVGETVKLAVSQGDVEETPDGMQATAASSGLDPRIEREIARFDGEIVT